MQGGASAILQCCGESPTERELLQTDEIDAEVRSFMLDIGNAGYACQRDNYMLSGIKRLSKVTTKWSGLSGASAHSLIMHRLTPDYQDSRPLHMPTLTLPSLVFLSLSSRALAAMRARHTPLASSAQRSDCADKPPGFQILGAS